jgi:hypothetical protein
MSTEAKADEDMQAFPLSNRTEYRDALYLHLPIKGIDQIVMDYLELHVFVNSDGRKFRYTCVGFPRFRFPPSVDIRVVATVTCSGMIWWQRNASDSIQHWINTNYGGINQFDTKTKATTKPMEICFDIHLEKITLELSLL